MNKIDYKAFRKEGCKYYELSRTTANKGLGNASAQLPLTSNEERQLKDNFFLVEKCMYMWKIMMMKFPLFIYDVIQYLTNIDARNPRSKKVKILKHAWHSDHLPLI